MGLLFRGGYLGFCMSMTILLAIGVCFGKDDANVYLVGSTECAHCTRGQGAVKDWNPSPSGLNTTIDCKSADGNLRKGVGVDGYNKGDFRIKFLEAEILKDGGHKNNFFLKLHSASGAPCPLQKAKRTFMVIFKFINNVKQTSAGTRWLKFSSRTSIISRPNKDNQILAPSPVKSNEGQMTIFPESETIYRKPFLPRASLNKNLVELERPVLISRKLLTLPIPFFPPLFPPFEPIIQDPSPELPPAGNPLPIPPPTFTEPLTPPAPTSNLQPIPPPVPNFKKPVQAPPPIYQAPGPVLSIPKKPPPSLPPTYEKGTPSPPMPDAKKPLTPPPTPYIKKPSPPFAPAYKNPILPPIPSFEKPSPPLTPTYKNPLSPPAPNPKKTLPPMAAPPMYRAPLLPPLAPIYKKPLPVPPPISHFKKPLPPISPIPTYTKPPLPPLAPTYQKSHPPPMNSTKPITKKQYPPPVPASKKSSPGTSLSPVSLPPPKPSPSPIPKVEPPPTASPKISFSPIPRAPPIPKLPPIPTVPRRYFNVPKPGHQAPTPPA